MWIGYIFGEDIGWTGGSDADPKSLAFFILAIQRILPSFCPVLVERRRCLLGGLALRSPKWVRYRIGRRAL